VIEPAVTGTNNVLKASVEAKVKRVVVVSSASAISMRPDWDREIMDESCWSDEQYCRTTEVVYLFRNLS
jgi:nucleoside-diphosphate-sugar epimerase